MTSPIDSDAGHDLSRIIEALEAADVDVTEVMALEQTERPIGSLGPRFEAELLISWEGKEPAQRTLGGGES